MENIEKKNKHRKKSSTADIAFTVFNSIFMILFVVITLYPVINTLAISLNDGCLLYTSDAADE